MKWLLVLTILTSCFGESDTYSREQFLSMARKGDPDLKLVAPKSISDKVVDCYDYIPNCRYGYRVIIKNVQMVVLFYDKPENAKKSARRLMAYRSRNWVLEEVKGEPILERFAKKYLKAVEEF